MKSRYIQNMIMKILEDNRLHTMREMAEKIEVNISTIQRHLIDLSFCYQGQNRRKANGAFQRVSQHHEVLHGRYSGTEKVSARRQKRVFESAFSRKHRADNKRKNADELFIGSQRVYATIIRRGNNGDGKRKRNHRV